MLHQDQEHQELKGWMPLILVGLIVGVFTYVVARGKSGGGRMAAPHPSPYVTPAANDGAMPAHLLGDSVMLTERGYALLGQAGHVIQAEDAFTLAVNRTPSSASAWNGLGWSRFKIAREFSDAASGETRFELAKAAFEQCLKIEPRNASALNGLGQLAMVHRRFEEAERYLLQATADPNAWLALFRLYLIQQRYGEAASWGSRVAAVRPDEPHVQMMLIAARAQNLDVTLKRYVEAELLPVPQAGSGTPFAATDVLQYLRKGGLWLKGKKRSSEVQPMGSDSQRVGDDVP